MKRLDTKSLPAFLETADIAVVFFGSADGDATMQQAEEFALLWSDVVTSDLVGVCFGYIDGSANWLAHGLLGVDELPVMLVVRDGKVTHRFEGRCSRGSVMAALRSPTPKRTVWRAPAPWQSGAMIGGALRQFDRHGP
jgi:hypothetical protein